MKNQSETNILTAIMNIVKSRNVNLQEGYIRANRANSVGDALEKYVTDSFSGTLLEDNESKRIHKVSQVFSYLGNDTNPPDGMLRGGAIGLKPKVEIICK